MTKIEVEISTNNLRLMHLFDVKVKDVVGDQVNVTGSATVDAKYLLEEALGDKVEKVDRIISVTKSEKGVIIEAEVEL